MARGTVTAVCPRCSARLDVGSATRVQCASCDTVFEISATPSAVAVGQFPAGWYADPAGGPGRRYWDGALWHDAAPARAGVPTKPKRGLSTRALIVAGVVVVGIVVVGNVVESNKADDKAAKSAASSSATSRPAPAKSSGGCGSIGPTCDGTPKADGRYKVSGGGVFDTGISPGWIATPGKRPGERACIWERLSGPIPNKLQMVIDAGRTELTSDAIYVQVQESDAYFWSEGCQPWVRIDR